MPGVATMSQAVLENVGLSAAGPTEAQSRKAIYAATIGNVMEWYDYGVYGFLAASISRNFFLKDDPKAALL
ncbi:MAG: MFS transporter, partial [Hyphomicrobiales bacterium]|nr:MFS transporter [Hyphomicrobiales bacterium]